MSDELAPNPFESARRIAVLSVILKPADLIEAWPPLSEQAAKRLLDLHGSRIAVQMLAAGIEAALAILKEEGAMS